MHHGNFDSGESDGRQRKEEGVVGGKGGREGGVGTGMIWLSWQNVQNKK